MKSILDLSDVPNVFPLKNQTVVLVGGCFDILHIGHITFLEAAKQKGDSLVILLESDLKIKKTKGPSRPINTQLDRAKIVSSLRMVDYVIVLPLFETAEEYDHLIQQIQPQIIATTKNDPSIEYKTRSGKLVNAKVQVVVDLIEDSSTSRIVNLLSPKS